MKTYDYEAELKTRSELRYERPEGGEVVLPAGTTVVVTSLRRAQLATGRVYLALARDRAQRHCLTLTQAQLALG